jgi:hypothetical protein
MTTTYAASTMPSTVEAAACSGFRWMQHPSAALLRHAEQHFTEAHEPTVVVAPSTPGEGAIPRTMMAVVNKAGSKATAKKAAVKKAPAKKAAAKKAATRPHQR